LRDAIAGVRVEMNLGAGSFKTQMKRADKSGAEFALILGEQELADGCAGLKPMRSTEEQSSVALNELAETLKKQLR
jgi:histidyl-tRNA synthetase